MRKIRWLIPACLLSAVLLVSAAVSFAYKAENVVIALVTKVVQVVEKKKETTEWMKATKGDLLSSGDEVQTGEKSLAIIKFTTDNSILRVREQSRLKLNREASAKSVELKKGGFGFNIRKQRENDPFRFTSPTAVASIRGTRGKLSSGSGGDTLVVTEGLVNLRNLFSNKDIDVGAGTIGFSNADGSLSSRKATQEELADAAFAAGGSDSNRLNIEMQDSKGKRKDLKFEYKK